MSNKHQAVILCVNTKHEMSPLPSLDQMIGEGNSSLLVLRNTEGGHTDTQLFNAITSICQLDSEKIS